MSIFIGLCIVILFVCFWWSLYSYIFADGQSPVQRAKNYMKWPEADGPTLHPNNRTDGFVEGGAIYSAPARRRLGKAIPDWIELKAYSQEIMNEIASHARGCQDNCLHKEMTERRLSPHFRKTYKRIRVLSTAAQFSDCEIVDAAFVHFQRESRQKVLGHKMGGVYDYEICVFTGTSQGSDAMPYAEFRTGKRQEYHTIKEGAEIVFKPQQDRTYVNQTEAPCIILRISYTSKNHGTDEAIDRFTSWISSILGF